ncbi:lipase 1-like isoform X2 [Scaptodrosophila lebanonensis]|uniref:Lipase 1-like isoform X2 n=1 Tax=Drosophila lebanonensis TaxID=7225 RepID=A0A6J2U4B1_DROLE|nr:lipase 1-like isoform X2 [Scaptodrosophila lebanonensis]
MINWLCGLCLAVQLATSGAGYLERNYPASVIQDARLTTLELLAKYRHPSEEHFVTTSDGYILALHRIPRPGAQPVLLVHGILDSSASWILMGPRNGLAYYLYDSGYDVWLGNCRGNTYSRNHTSLNPSKDRAFWNFSWHEIGLYDLPAMIDKVLDATSFKKLTYYGHSQGTTVFFVMASSLPAYNDKVILINALAPVAFLNHIKTKLVKVVRAMMALLFGKDKPMELLPRSKLMLKMCFISKTVLNLCMNYVSRAVGGDMKKINKVNTLEDS